MQLELSGSVTEKSTKDPTKRQPTMGRPSKEPFKEPIEEPTEEPTNEPNLRKINADCNIA